MHARQPGTVPASPPRRAGPTGDGSNGANVHSSIGTSYPWATSAYRRSAHNPGHLVQARRSPASHGECWSAGAPEYRRPYQLVRADGREGPSRRPWSGRRVGGNDGTGKAWSTD